MRILIDRSDWSRYTDEYITAYEVYEANGDSFDKIKIHIPRDMYVDFSIRWDNLGEPTEVCNEFYDIAMMIAEDKYFPNASKWQDEDSLFDRYASWKKAKAYEEMKKEVFTAAPWYVEAVEKVYLMDKNGIYDKINHRGNELVEDVLTPLEYKTYNAFWDVLTASGKTLDDYINVGHYVARRIITICKDPRRIDKEKFVKMFHIDKIV